MISTIFQWYFGPGDSPFLQWVPGSGSPPQTVDIHRGSQNQFKNRLKVKYNLSNVTSEKGLLSQNSTQVHKLDLSVRIARPSVHLSGIYTCKVATFFDEQKSTHSVIIYGKNIIVHILKNFSEFLFKLQERNCKKFVDF